MATVGYRRINVNVRATNTTSVRVPNNCYARLMYYLHCIDECVPGIIPESLTCYQLYHLLDTWGLKETLVLAANRLPPLFCDDIIFFHNENIDSDNKFLEISVAQNTVAAVPISDGGAVVIAGQRVRVSKVMLYKAAWARKYYADALASASRKLAGQSCCTIL